MGQDNTLQPKEVAVRIKFWRKKAGLRNKHIAKALGVTPGCVSLWEHGHAEPSHETISRLAQLCGTDIAGFWSAPIVVVEK
jgi:transcriptional regulator with XRE-family HTH domain